MKDLCHPSKELFVRHAFCSILKNINRFNLKVKIYTAFEQIFENFLSRNFRRKIFRFFSSKISRMSTKYENKWKFEKNGFKPKTFSTNLVFKSYNISLIRVWILGLTLNKFRVQLGLWTPVSFLVEKVLSLNLLFFQYKQISTYFRTIDLNILVEPKNYISMLRKRELQHKSFSFWGFCWKQSNKPLYAWSGRTIEIEIRTN